MRCPHCQPENCEGACYCATWGSSFASKCPACGRQPPPGAAFCDQCGTPLTGTTTLRLRRHHCARFSTHGLRGSPRHCCKPSRSLLRFCASRDASPFENEEPTV